MEKDNKQNIGNTIPTVTTPIKALPALIKKTETFKLVIPENVQEKIEYICKKIHEVEWSGTLFYKQEGTIENKDLSITALDIFVQDIGTAAYTEFDQSPDVIGYACQHPELLENEVQMGLVHSHNNMATFFSGTDTATLNEEGNDRNHFVSLIVNNAGPYSAGITKKSVISQEITQREIYNTFDNEIIEAAPVKFEVSATEVHWYSMTVLTPERVNNTNIEIDERLAEIKAAKAAKIATTYQYPQYGTTYGRGYNQGNKPHTNFSTYEAETDYEDVNNEKPYVNIKDTAKTTKQENTQLALDLEEEEVPYGKIFFDKEEITLVVKQLLSGNILISAKDPITVAQYAAKSDKLFKQRFGNLKFFKEWADQHVEFLITNTWDPMLLNLGEEGMSALCAYDTQTVLTALPQNQFITEYIKMLDLYLI